MPTHKIIILLMLFSACTFAKEFKGAEYRTKAAYTYGRFEVNYKSAQKEGVLSTFFTYHEISSTQEWNEIDIEILGRYTDNVQFNTITAGQTNHVRSQVVDFNPALDYHTYAFEWTPDYIAWFVDGTEVYRQTGAHVQTVTRAQKIMMNIWNPIYDNWVGDWNPAVLPAFAYYDWVKYYSYTPGTGSYGTGNNFSFIWKDDFDSWDQSRWEKATHTWPGNNSDFVRENVVFRDGKMILCLTTADNLGYTDNTIPAALWARAEDNKIRIRFSEDLDEASAENKALFIISGVTVNSAELLNDNVTVELTVSGLNSGKNYTVLLLAGVKDVFGNSSVAKALTVNMPKPLIFPVKINIGGPAWNDYLADQEWSEALEYGYLDGSAGSTSAQINNTDEDAVFQSERYGLVTYRIRVPDGTYKVTVMASENYFNSAESRKFDIYAEGTLAADNLDLFKTAGKSTAHFIEILNVKVSDGILDIHFAGEVDNPLANGLVVEQISTGIDKTEDLPESFRLMQNFPNPFNGETTISYYIPEKQKITFSVYDMIGNEVYRKEFSSAQKGINNISWRADDNSGNPLASGIYIYSLAGASARLSRKLILLK